jgi:predicted nucleic acid-binding protein
VPTRSRRPDCLVDTSAAIPLLLGGHPEHAAVLGVLRRRRRGLAGHAAFETFSVLTRLPAPDRVAPADAAQLITRSFPETRHLGPEQAAALIARLPALGIAGGHVYDALVGAVAAEHDIPLVTRDRRAAEIYHRLGARLELLA